VGTALSKYNATIRAADQNLQLALAAEVARIEEANCRLEALPTEIQSPELVQQTITSLQIAVQELERASAPNTKFKATYKHSLQEIHDDQCRKLHRSIARLSTAVEEAKRKQLVASRPIKLCGVCRHEMCAKDGAQDPRNPNSYCTPTATITRLCQQVAAVLNVHNPTPILKDTGPKQELTQGQQAFQNTQTATSRRIRGQGRIISFAGSRLTTAQCPQVQWRAAPALHGIPNFEVPGCERSVANAN